MPTAPFSKQIVLWGDSRITANITEAEAFHTWPRTKAFPTALMWIWINSGSPSTPPAAHRSNPAMIG